MLCLHTSTEKGHHTYRWKKGPVTRVTNLLHTYLIWESGILVYKRQPVPTQSSHLYDCRHVASCLAVSYNTHGDTEECSSGYYMLSRGLYCLWQAGAIIENTLILGNRGNELVKNCLPSSTIALVQWRTLRATVTVRDWRTDTCTGQTEKRGWYTWLNWTPNHVRQTLVNFPDVSIGKCTNSTQIQKRYVQDFKA